MKAKLCLVVPLYDLNSRPMASRVFWSTAADYYEGQVLVSNPAVDASYAWSTTRVSTDTE